MESNGRDFWDALVAMTPAAQPFHSQAMLTSPYDADPLMLTCFIHCYNNEATIVEVLDKIVEAMHAAETSYEIFVIDDASKDGSVQRVRQYILQHPECPLVLRANRRCKRLAQNYIDAAFMGRGKYFRLIYADNAEPMETLAELFRVVGEADIIIPYYINSGGRVPEELVFTKSYRYLMNALSRQRINNYDGEPVHLRYNVMRWHPDTLGAGFHSELLGRLLMLKFTYKQLPCRTVFRRHGHHDEAGEQIAWRDAFSLVGAVVRLVIWRISFWTYQ